MTVINDFIFSLNTVLPVFILVMVGWYIRHRGTVDESFIGAVSNVVFYYALPAGIFMDVATTDLHELVNPRFVAVTMLGTAGVFFTAWFVISRIYHDGREVAAAVHSAYRGNYIYIGVPIIQNILQTTTLTCSVLVITFVLSLYNVLAVLILSVYSGDMSQLNFKHLALTLLKNPMIIATLLGIAYALTGLPLTPVAAKSLGYLKVIASPLALLMIAMRMVGNSAKGKGGLIRLALLFKLVLGPLVMTCVAVLLGMSQEEIVTISVLFGTPCAMNVYIMTKSMGGDDGTAASIIVSSVLLSILTMTAGIFLLRTAGIV